MLRKSAFFVFLLAGIFALVLMFIGHRPDERPLKLYWFIPDGMRAEPDLFNIYRWAEAGELPNIKKMMDEGSFGFSIPSFPSHTPVNFATLLTGSDPTVHGVADGPMHTEGHSLDKVSVAGFSSLGRKIPASWSFFEEQGMKVGIISTPGSTPPELGEGIVVRGRWGNWGFDTPALNFEYVADNTKRYERGRSGRLFFFFRSATYKLCGFQ